MTNHVLTKNCTNAKLKSLKLNETIQLCAINNEVRLVLKCYLQNVYRNRIYRDIYKKDLTLYDLQ